MKTYFRVFPGRKSRHIQECVDGNFIGIDPGVAEDLTGQLPESWRDFNERFIPVYLAAHPEKNRIAAGSACGALWTLARYIQPGDVVLCPDGSGRYHVGEVTGGYVYTAGANLPHRRPVKWLPQVIDRNNLSEAFQRSIWTGNPVVTIESPDYVAEVESLLQGCGPLAPLVADAVVESAATFALEKHLEDFLVQNWANTELGKTYDIYEEDGELLGRQYPTSTGPLDILAISKDRKELLVIELKKGRASDQVVGQILRYMGFVQQERCEPGQTVRGIIIGLEDDRKIRLALTMIPSVEFYRYEITFKLVKG